jgi:hypothetical protein
MSLLAPSRLLLACAVVLGLAGCATYEVKVDAIARSGGTGNEPASFRIRNVTPGLANDGLRFRETAAQIKTALASRGFWEAPASRTPQVFVDVAFGVDAPRTRLEEDDRPVFAARRDLPGAGPADAFETAPASPATGGKDVVGFDPVLRRTIVYPKHLSVVCRESASRVAGKPPLELWSVDATIEDESKNLREYLPALTAAVMTKIGRTTDGIAAEELGKNSDAIAYIKQGM